jgi:hypothetical protein
MTRSANEDIIFPRHKLSHAYDMIGIMPAKDKSVTAMIHEIDNGADDVDAYARRGLSEMMWARLASLGYRKTSLNKNENAHSIAF